MPSPRAPRLARRDRSGRRPDARRAAGADRPTTRARAPTLRSRRSRPCSRSIAPTAASRAATLVRPGRRRRRLHGHVGRRSARGEASRRSARIHTIATGACAPTDLIYSAIPATRRALERSGLGHATTWSVIEVNEAFACAPVALMREFGMPPDSAAHQPQRRRLRHRASGGRVGRPTGRHDRAGAAPPRRPLRPRHDLRRHGSGRGDDPRTSVSV